MVKYRENYMATVIKNENNKFRDVVLSLLSLLSALTICWVDIITPLGVTHWVLYVVPLLLIYLTGNIRFTLMSLFVIAILVFIGGIWTGGVPTPRELGVIDKINRVEGMFVFLLFSLIIINLIKSRRHFKQAKDEVENKKNELVVSNEKLNEALREVGKLNRELTAESERLAITLRSIGDGVITTDTAGAVVILNRVAEELCGWTLREAQGKQLTSVFTIIDEKTRKPRENPVEKVLATGRIIEIANHTVMISKDGVERVIADSAAPIKDKNDKIIGVVLVFRDITEKQKLLETTQRNQKLESLGVLAGGIAHDFNNLMGGIFGYIDLASEESKDERVVAHLSKAMNTIDRARGLTRQLLTFAKGGDPVQKIDSLFPFVKETALFALSGSNVSCFFDVTDDLWACNIDKNQIGQVIDNLVINAQQAMPLGGAVGIKARNIALSEKEHPSLTPGNYVKLTIRDRGVGIPRDLITRIFDPFFTTKAAGHGLGLATCHSIISRHGGCIDVESQPGNGSAFFVYLPASGQAPEGPIAAPPAYHRGHGVIIVMDDEEVIRNSLEEMLKTMGYTVICKDDGREALDQFNEGKANRPCVAMIFDLTVPGGMGGKEAVEEIRKSDKEIPVFVASGYAADPVMKNPRDYGFTDSICKPFIMTELAEMLEKHLTKRA